MAPAPTTVWAVRLGAGDHDVQGMLTLEFEALVFAMESAELRIALTDVKRARRVRGSPILVVDHQDSQGPVSHAFFFSKPPPMKSPKGKSKRKNARQSIIYLQSENRDLKPAVVAWEKAINDGRSRRDEGG